MAERGNNKSKVAGVDEGKARQGKGGRLGGVSYLGGPLFRSPL